MKTKQLRPSLLSALLASGLLLSLSPSAVADPAMVDALFKEGRAAYLRGDHDTALTLLGQVRQINPRHIPSQAMLRQIELRHQADPGRELRAALTKLTLKKVEFVDLDLQTATEVLTTLAITESGGKIKPSFVLKGIPEDSPKISLHLSNVPMTEVIRYVSSLTKTTVRYDKHAIVLTSNRSAEKATVKPTEATE